MIDGGIKFMNEELLKKNEVEICGTVRNMISPVYHDGKKYFQYIVSVKRNSGLYDDIPVYAANTLKLNSKVHVNGRLEYKTSNSRNGNRGELVIIAEDVSDASTNDMNNVRIGGIITKLKEPKKVSDGKRIRRFVQVGCGSRNSIPCILWGEKSKKVLKGECITGEGRFQTRACTNRPVFVNGEAIWSPIYEISLHDFEKA